MLRRGGRHSGYRSKFAFGEFSLDTLFAIGEYTDMDIAFSRSAIKVFAGFPKPEQKNMLRRLEAIAANPEARHNSVTALQGRLGYFRLRVGKYRVVFCFDLENDRMVVETAGHRREVYR